MKTVDRARGRWREILPRLGIATRFLVNRHGPCPLCGGKDRFRFDDRNGSGSYYCGQCGPGHALLMVQKHRSWDWATACREVDKIIGYDPSQRQLAAEEPDLDRLRQKLVETLNEATAPHLVERYLRWRGLKTVPSVLRGHPSLPYVEDGVFKGRHPAMLAPVVGPDGELRSAHRTYLADVPTRKKLLSQVGSGASVRLFDPAEHLGLGEGVETSIAVYELFGVPTWATISASIMENFTPPKGLKRLTIFADNDPKFVGQKAAYSLAHRLARDCHELVVNVKVPPAIDTDWLDVLLSRKTPA